MSAPGVYVNQAGEAVLVSGGTPGEDGSFINSYQAAWSADAEYTAGDIVSHAGAPTWRCRLGRGLPRPGLPWDTVRPRGHRSGWCSRRAGSGRPGLHQQGCLVLRLRHVANDVVTRSAPYLALRPCRPAVGSRRSPADARRGRATTCRPDRSAASIGTTCGGRQLDGSRHPEAPGHSGQRGPRLHGGTGRGRPMRAGPRVVRGPPAAVRCVSQAARSTWASRHLRGDAPVAVTRNAGDPEPGIDYAVVLRQHGSRLVAISSGNAVTGGNVTALGNWTSGEPRVHLIPRTGSGSACSATPRHGRCWRRPVLSAPPVRPG